MNEVYNRTHIKISILVTGKVPTPNKILFSNAVGLSTQFQHNWHSPRVIKKQIKNFFPARKSKMADQGQKPSIINFAGAVNEQVMESIKNLDVATVLQRMVAQTPEDEESEEIREKLQGVMKKFYEMSEEEQEQFSQQIRQGLASKISARMSDPDNPLKLDGLEDAIRSAVVNQLILVGVVGAILLFVFGMFFFI